jgi:hypothetical protein
VIQCGTPGFLGCPRKERVGRLHEVVLKAGPGRQIKVPIAYIPLARIQSLGPKGKIFLR